MRNRLPLLTGAIGAVFIGIIAGPASAQTVILSCQPSGFPEPFTVTVDLTHMTVSRPASGSSKSHPIQVSDTMISWDENPDFWMKFQLDRVTLYLQGVGNDASGTVNGNRSNSQCRKSEKQL
jgi:hypothetical protein